MSRTSLKDAELDLIFSALADTRRRKVLLRLIKGPLIVKEIGAEFEMSKPAVGKHVNILEKSGLIKRKEIGRSHHCELNQKAIKKVENWISCYQKYWTESLDEMDAYASTLSKKKRNE
ncbi:MAG: ArsR/SmtB family transcription factor [Gammaproteobacteria bacterium]|jgi:DNA-binding transcriptional ArsR family regulator